MSLPISPWTLCRIKFYRALKGYGFAYRENIHEDIFIHASTLQKVGFRGTLKPELQLEVQYIRDPKGLRAINLRWPE